MSSRNEKKNHKTARRAKAVAWKRRGRNMSERASWEKTIGTGVRKETTLRGSCSKKRQKKACKRIAEGKLNPSLGGKWSPREKPTTEWGLSKRGGDFKKQVKPRGEGVL